MFIQATAWFIEMDMLIVDTSCTEENPYIHISGNLENQNHSCKERLYLRSKSNSHYQSLLEIDSVQSSCPKQETQNMMIESPLTKGSKERNYKQSVIKDCKANETKENKSKEQKEYDEEVNTVNTHGNKGCTLKPFIYESNGNCLELPCLSENYVMKCPKCNMESRYIVQHLTKNLNCKLNIESFEKPFQLYKNLNKSKLGDEDKEKI